MTFSQAKLFDLTASMISYPPRVLVALRHTEAFYLMTLMMVASRALRPWEGIVAFLMVATTAFVGETLDRALENRRFD